MGFDPGISIGQNCLIMNCVSYINVEIWEECDVQSKRALLL